MKVSLAFTTGMFLLLVIGFSFLIGMGGLLAGYTVSALDFPLAFLLSGTVVWLTVPDRRNVAISIGVSAVTIAASLWLGYILPDYSFDGQWYHTETIASLAEGWNPLHNHGDGARYDLTQWSVSYVKGLEMISATIFRLTGELESGKAVNFLLILSGAMIWWWLLGEIRQTMSRGHRVMLTILTTACPVAVCQMVTFYLDYACYYYIILTIAFSVSVCQRRFTALSIIALSMIIILAIATKFTHFLYEGITVMAILLWLLIRKDRRNFSKLLLICGVAGCVGLFIFSYHPYITNWLWYGNPFYPLMGEGKVDIMLPNTPECYLGHNRVVNLFISLFSRVEIPLVDARALGFGPLSQLLFVISLIVIIVSVIRRKRLTVTVYAALIAVCSSLLFEQTWWARYIPQLWLIVPIAYYETVCRSDMKYRKLIAGIISWVSVVNIAICLFVNLFFTARGAAYRSVIYETCQGQPIRASVRNFRAEDMRKHGIDVEIVNFWTIPEERQLSLQIVPIWDNHYQIIECDSTMRAEFEVLYENNDVLNMSKSLGRIYNNMTGRGDER